MVDPSKAPGHNGLTPAAAYDHPLEPARKVVLKTPEEITAYVLANFDTVSEEQIGQWERDVAKACPESDERALLYALRVSKCIATVKSFKTVNSRWWLAESGPKSGRASYAGLIAGMGSPNHQRTHSLLTSVYTNRVEELCRDAVTEAENHVAKLKAQAATSKTFEAACNKLESASEKLDNAGSRIEEAFFEVGGHLLSHERRDAWYDYLSSKHDELAELCLRLFEDLCREIIAKAEKGVAAGDTEDAKCAALYAAIDEIKEAADRAVDFGADTKVWIDCLESKLKAVGPKELESATCDGCGNSPRVVTRIESGQYVCRTCLREIRAS